MVTTDPAKIIKGVDIDNEYNAISNSIASKADVTSPNLLGTPTSPTASTGTNTTQIASTAFVKQEITALALGTISTQAASAVAITGGTITGITDLTVADGGTGVSTLTANSVLIGNGTSAITSIAPGTSGNVLKSNGSAWTSSAPTAISGLGFNGETWNDVSASRASGTTYTNSRSYPIMIAVSTANGTSQSVIVVVGGVTVSNQVGGGSGYTQGVMGTAIVPAGSTYSVTYSGSSPKWTELY